MIKSLEIAIVFLLMLSSSTFAEETSFKTGNEAFDKKDFKTAIEAYEKEITEHPDNSAAYFNLGLAYNAEKMYGKAIWAFERALKLRPNDGETMDNIEQNYSELGRKPQWRNEYGHFSRTIFSYHSDFWAILSITFSVLTGLFIVLMRRSPKLSKRRSFFFSALGTAIFMLFSIYAASDTFRFENSNEFAVVTQKSITAFNNKSTTKEGDAIQLHEGTKLKIVRWSEKNRVQLETPEGKTVYVDPSDVDRI